MNTVFRDVKPCSLVAKGLTVCQTTRRQVSQTAILTVNVKTKQKSHTDDVCQRKLITVLTKPLSGSDINGS
jgi:hypothetical protein